MLVINEKDIRKSISLKGLMDVIENSYSIYDKGSYYMPDRVHIDKGNKTIL